MIKAIVGLQWGDEGKGKITNFLAQKSQVIVRYQGGNNAGHSIVFNGKKWALSHLPSGIFQKDTINILGQGMVINPQALIEEINYLKNNHAEIGKLYISDRAHVIMPYHLDIDQSLEKIQNIGTTKKGIGPAYSDKYQRIGIRFCDFVNFENLKKVLKSTLEIKNQQLKNLNLKTYDFDSLLKKSQLFSQQLQKYVVNTSLMLDKLILEKKTILFEGAQGAMLCIENGTYPFVTSSSPTAGAIGLGAGVDYKKVQTVIGVVKAYTTRVGSGFFATEIEGLVAEQIQKEGHEFGTVTQRPRRIGWLDLVVLKHSIAIQGVTQLCITLLDVLSILDEIKICYQYQLKGQEIDYIPASIFDYSQVKPLYYRLKGWKKDLSKIKKFQDLPLETKEYLKKIEDFLKIPITIISVGPDREQTIEI